MRLATIMDGDRTAVAVVSGDDVLLLPPDDPALGAGSMRAIAAGGVGTLDQIREWASAAPAEVRRPLDAITMGAAIPDPGAIYTIGRNYRPVSGADDDPPERPLVFGKAVSSVSGHRATVAWDRGVTANVDAEVELGVVIGSDGDAFAYTCVNDISSRDAWLDGDQWMLGKSFAGFCPIGPWLVTADELDPSDLRLACTIDGEPIQEGRTSRMRFAIPEILAYLGRHLRLRPGDLVVTGTPERLAAPPGPDRRLRPGDEVTVSIDGIGDLTTFIR